MLSLRSQTARERGCCPDRSTATPTSPIQAIQSATINAADLIGHPELFGSITAGTSTTLSTGRAEELLFSLNDCDHVPLCNRFDLGLTQSGEIGGLGGLYSPRKLDVMPLQVLL